MGRSYTPTEKKSNLMLVNEHVGIEQSRVLVIDLLSAGEDGQCLGRGPSCQSLEWALHTLGTL